MADYGPYTKSQLRTRLAGPGDLYHLAVSIPGVEGMPMAETEDGEFCQVGKTEAEALEALIVNLMEFGLYAEERKPRWEVKYDASLWTPPHIVRMFVEADTRDEAIAKSWDEPEHDHIDPDTTYIIRTRRLE